MAAVEIRIYDPPMCCSSGLCGPTIDPALVQVNELITRIKKDYSRTATIERHMLGKDLQSFQNNPKLLELIKREGTKILPVVTVNGEIIKIQGYPTMADLQSYLAKGE